MDKVSYRLILYGMFFLFCQCGRERPILPRLRYEALGFLHPLERAAIARNKVSAIFVINPLNPLTGETNDTLWTWHFDTLGNFIAGEQFWHSETCRYDSLHRMIQSKYFSCFGETSHYEYHRFGDQQLIRLDTINQDSSWIRFNPEGYPLELLQKSGMQPARIAFEYDRQGMLVRKTITNPVNISSPFNYFGSLPLCDATYSALQYDYLLSQGNLTMESFRYITVCEGDTVEIAQESHFNKAGLRDFLVVNPPDHKLQFQYRHYAADGH